LLISETIDGKTVVEVYFSCQWQPKLRTRQGQVGAFDIHPIQEQHMEMDIEIQRTAESLAEFILIEGARFFSPFPRRV
jgi:hypothetical protein